MPKHRALIVATVVLALAALVPGSVSAKAGGTDRSVQGSASGMDIFNVQTLDFSADYTGIASHIGEYTGHFEGTFTVTRIVAAGGGFTFVATNGDLLSGEFALGELLPGGTSHPVSIFLAITGGTGRFADASGSLDMTLQASPFSLDQGILREPVEGTVTGKISY
jgi:hypothetical protein